MIAVVFGPIAWLTAPCGCQVDGAGCIAILVGREVAQCRWYRPGTQTRDHEPDQHRRRSSQRQAKPPDAQAVNQPLSAHRPVRHGAKPVSETCGVAIPIRAQVSLLLHRQVRRIHSSFSLPGRPWWLGPVNKPCPVTTRTKISTRRAAGGLSRSPLGGRCVGRRRMPLSAMVSECDIRDVPHVEIYSDALRPPPRNRSGVTVELYAAFRSGGHAGTRAVIPLSGRAPRSRPPQMTELTPPVRPEQLKHKRGRRGRG